MFRHQRREMPGHGRFAREGHDRCADHAGIDELAGRQALAVAAAGGGHCAVPDGNQVGGGAADIDQQGLADAGRNQMRGGMPVGGSDPLGMLAGLADIEPAMGARVKIYPASPQALIQKGGQRLHTGLPCRKQIDHFSGHGDGMRAGTVCRHRGFDPVDGLTQLVEAAPERAGFQPDAGEPVIGFDPRGFQMCAADVPSDQGAVQGGSAHGGVHGHCDIRSSRSGPAGGHAPGAGGSGSARTLAAGLKPSAERIPA